MLEKFKKSLVESYVVKRGNYDYFVNPLTSGVLEIKPEIIKEICESIISCVDIKTFNVIITIEAMGIHITSVLSQMTGIPFNIVRKRSQHTPEEIVLKNVTGYGTSNLYMSLPKNEKVLIVDSVVSTGGTLISVINGLKKLNADIKDIVCVIERGNGVKKVKEKTNYDVKTLVKIDIKNGKVVLV